MSRLDSNDSVLSVQTALAAWPSLPADRAMGRALRRSAEPLWGRLGVRHVQICPQNRQLVNGAMIERLRAISPTTQYRLHANVNVLDGARVTWDCADVHNPERRPYFMALAAVSKALGAPAYTLHAGTRASDYDLAELYANIRDLEQMFGCRVGVEGLYPHRFRDYMIASWAEYRWLLESGLDYALDLSHLNIVASHEGVYDDGLVAEMLASEHCIEIHVSGNDGRTDSHDVLREPPWWYSALQANANPDAVIFSEGNQLHARRRHARRLSP